MNDIVLENINEIAKKYNVEKVILFGSRARGDNLDTSDYDLAIFAEDLNPITIARFSIKIDEIETLKKIDLVYVDKNTDGSLLDNIIKEGMIIYEKARE